MAIPKPKPAVDPKATQDLYEALWWINRCAKMARPLGTTVYIISDEAMARAKAAVAKAEGTPNG